jgi:NAD(P)-dependent dehydrogenase (short-subunit alcohol dehydrogenase family)
LASLVAEINGAGGEATYLTADAADFDQVAAVAEAAYSRYGRLDTWVHTAGVALFAEFERTTPEEFRRVIEVNLLGQVYGAMAALPFLKKTGGGALIHVSSVEAHRSVPFQSAYGASKHGIKGFIQALRLELQNAGVPVSVTEILPAAVNTPIWDKGRNKFARKVRPPLPPVYHPRVVSNAIAFAAENATREMTAGGAGLGVAFTERLSPKLADRVTAAIGFDQFEEEFDDPGRPDGMFGTVPELDTVEGRFSDEQWKHDPYVWARTHPRLTRAVITAAGGALLGFLVRGLRSRRSERQPKLASTQEGLPARPTVQY